MCLNAPSQSFLHLSDAGMMYNQSAFPLSCGTRIHHRLWLPAAAHLCCDSHPFQRPGVHISRPAAPLHSCPSTFSSVSPLLFLIPCRKVFNYHPKFPISPSLAECVNKWVNNFSPEIYLMFHNTSSASMRLLFLFRRITFKKQSYFLSLFHFEALHKYLSSALDYVCIDVESSMKSFPVKITNIYPKHKDRTHFHSKPRLPLGLLRSGSDRECLAFPSESVGL